MFVGTAEAATPTVEVIGETNTHLTYKISHEHGIQQLTFNYEAEGVDPGEISMVTEVHRYDNCPPSVTITVPKEAQLENDNEIGWLIQLMVENCQAEILDKEKNKYWIFEILNNGLDVGPDPQEGLITPTKPPPPAPSELNFFEWQFAVLFVWTVVTLYLLWWRLFGPFRPR
jgi:hypothetical protein